MTNKEYLKNQFKKLIKHDLKIKVFDGEGNSTNYLNITPNNIKQILKILTKDKTKFELADKLYFIFMDHLCDSDIAEFVESDPDNLPSGTRNTEKGMKLFNEIESALEDL
tara:strand:+ start:504 stop:833 length:330 start_codon:yes stop_codon:yes gene_type:complete